MVNSIFNLSGDFQRSVLGFISAVVYLVLKSMCGGYIYKHIGIKALTNIIRMFNMCSNLI